MDTTIEHPDEVLQTRFEADICFARITRPHAANTINRALVEQLTQLLLRCDIEAKVVVLEGLPDVFCTGADFNELQQSANGDDRRFEQTPQLLYDLWQRLACGPYITVAHVRGQTNAGGVGLVAACDLVLSEERATFALSELLFGLMPACVMPFLVRRIGVAKASYMTLTTQPIGAKQAEAWGLVDACSPDSEGLLRKQLLRLRRLRKDDIARYKRYVSSLDATLAASRSMALQANAEVFSDPTTRQNISRYVRTGKFPWEAP